MPESEGVRRARAKRREMVRKRILVSPSVMTGTIVSSEENCYMLFPCAGKIDRVAVHAARVGDVVFEVTVYPPTGRVFNFTLSRDKLGYVEPTSIEVSPGDTIMFSSSQNVGCLTLVSLLFTPAAGVSRMEADDAGD